MVNTPKPTRKDSNDTLLSSYESRRLSYERSSRLFSNLLGRNEIVWEDCYQIRSLTAKEISTLEVKCHCRCSDWTSVLLMYEIISPSDDNMNDLSICLDSQVSRCHFAGSVIIGVVLEGSSSSTTPQSSFVDLPHGIHNNMMIKNCILEPHCRVYGNSLIEKTHVCADASIIDCGKISQTKDGGTLLTTPHEIVIGPESGGERKVTTYPETTLVDVCQQLKISRFGQQPQRFPKPNLSSLHSKDTLNILSPHSSLFHTSVFLSTYLSPHSSIIHSPHVSTCVLLPHATITHSTAISTILQWNANISHSHVTNTFLSEQSSIGPSSTISSSIIGPDSHVSTGEIHASLLGPSTAAHHQSLVISCICPLGRINVGYGSNVGSNHTLRLPDRECWAGEGFFFGLGCNVTFPFNGVEAPYSVIGSGVRVEANMKVMFPFSLIMDGGKVFPGWVLRYSPYTIERNGRKFVKRRKAKRHGFYTKWEIMRWDLVETCRKARLSLLEGNKRTDPWGKCVLDKKAIERGVKSYTNFIKRYALKGLLKRLQEDLNVDTTLESWGGMAQANNKIVDISTHLMALPWENQISQEEEWKYQCLLLSSEFSPKSSIRDLLYFLLRLEEDYVNSVYRSRKKDDERGLDVIPLYEEGHVMADADEVVTGAKKELEQLRNKVESFMGIVIRSRL